MVGWWSRGDGRWEEGTRRRRERFFGPPSTGARQGRMGRRGGHEWRQDRSSGILAGREGGFSLETDDALLLLCSTHEKRNNDDHPSSDISPTRSAQHAACCASARGAVRATAAILAALSTLSALSALGHASSPRGIILIATCSPVARSRHSCTRLLLPRPSTRMHSYRGFPPNGSPQAAIVWFLQGLWRVKVPSGSRTGRQEGGGERKRVPFFFSSGRSLGERKV